MRAIACSLALLATAATAPALAQTAGKATDVILVGKEAGQAWVDDYTGRCYHQACDAVSDGWNLAGAVQDIEVMYAIGEDLAQSDRWPGWKDGSEFKKIREASANARK